MRRVCLLSGCAWVLAMVGYGHAGSEQAYSGPYPIKVVCTTGMVADLARNVGGPHVRVEQIMGADVDPHLYKATPGDMRKMSGTDVVFYSGLHLEGKMSDVFTGLARKIPCVAVAEHIKRIKHELILTDPEGTHDPHVWFDVSLWSIAAEAVRDSLVKYDPSHAVDYRSRSDKYQAELAKLHEYARERIASVPKEQRVLITSHDAFRYFGRAYDIEVKGIQGISTESEAGLKDIENLVRFLTQRKVRAVFVETSVSPRPMQALRDGCASAGHIVALGGELFSDAMGKEDTPEGTYVGMVRHNVDTIVNALVADPVASDVSEGATFPMNGILLFSLIPLFILSVLFFKFVKGGNAR